MGGVLLIDIERFLEQTADRHSWYGGGSAAALVCALSAALLEKLACLPSRTRGRQAGWTLRGKTTRTIRAQCARLIEVDARAFARVIRASARHDRLAEARALKTAIEVPWQVHRYTQRLLQVAQRMRTAVSPRYQADLRCAEALAKASGNAARALVNVNLRWLDDPAARRRIRQQLARLA